MALTRPNKVLWDEVSAHFKARSSKDGTQPPFYPYGPDQKLLDFQHWPDFYLDRFQPVRSIGPWGIDTQVECNQYHATISDINVPVLPFYTSISVLSASNLNTTATDI